MENDFLCESYFDNELQDSAYILMSDIPTCTSCADPELESAIQEAIIDTSTDTTLNNSAYLGTFSLEIIIGKNGSVLKAQIIDDELDSSIFHRKFIEKIKKTQWKPGQCYGKIITSRFVVPTSISYDSDQSIQPIKL